MAITETKYQDVLTYDRAVFKEVHSYVAQYPTLVIA